MKQSIKAKIISSFGFLLAVMIVLQGMNLYSVRTLSDSNIEVLSNDVPKLALAKEYAKQVVEEIMYVRGFLVTGDISYINNYNQTMEEAKQSYDAVLNMLVNEEDIQLLNKARTAETELQKIFEESIQAKKSSREDELTSILAKGTTYTGGLFAALETLEAKVTEDMNETAKQQSNMTKVLLALSMILLLVGVVSTFGTGTLLAGGISKPIKALDNAFNRMADGDLTIEELNLKKNKIKEINNLVGSFNSMLKNTKELISQVMASTNTVSASSRELMSASETASATTEEIATSVQQVATGAEKQNNNLNEVSNSISELAKGTEVTAVSMQEISNEVDIVNKLSDSSKSDLDTVIEQMNIINETSQESVDKVKSLEDRSKAIQKIVEVITDISEQTNLLALNAAIEAARAGEAGKGFAVVADEIRKLAEQSSNSTKGILDIVNTIQAEVSEVISTIEREEKVIEEGVTKVNAATESFDRIIMGIDEITTRVQDVTAVTEQMSSGTEQIVNSIKAISDISGENAAISEEVTASVEEQTSTMQEVTASATSLSELSANLLEIVSKFKI